MSKLDRLIEDALDKEDRALLAQYGEQGMIAQFGELFSGKLGFVNLASAVAQVVMFGGALYAGSRFIAVDDLGAMVRWGSLCGLLMAAMSVIKLMHWAQIQANRVIREVKRVELQIARSKAV